MSYINLLQVVLADSTGTTADAAEQGSEMTLSFLDLALKGGWIMIPIVVLFAIAI